jgi:hypothetical protein
MDEKAKHITPNIERGIPNTEHQTDLEQLRPEIAIGIEQADRGELFPLDFESIKVEGRQLLSQEGIKSL